MPSPDDAAAVQVSGRWGPGAVVVRVVESTRRRDADVDRHVEATWQSRLQAGIPLYDGAMCRLETVTLADGRLTLDVSRTSYKAFVGTNLYPPPGPPLPDAMLARPVGVSPAVRTADGFLVLGVRSDRVAYYPRRLHPFSGALDWNDAGPPDVFAECRRELGEELNLPPAAVTHLAVLAVIEDAAIRHPEVLLSADVSATLADLRHHLDPAEHDALHAIPADRHAVDALLNDPAESRRLTPVASATLRAWAGGLGVNRVAGPGLSW